jgi:hypothetical protein
MARWPGENVADETLTAVFPQARRLKFAYLICEIFAANRHHSVTLYNPAGLNLNDVSP